MTPNERMADMAAYDPHDDPYDPEEEEEEFPQCLRCGHPRDRSFAVALCFDCAVPARA